jgi:hypothetical protein
VRERELPRGGSGSCDGLAAHVSLGSTFVYQLLRGA